MTADPYTCPTCDVTYPSFRAYTKADEHYAARFASDDGFAADDADPTLEPVKHYGKPMAESFDHEPQDPGVTSNQYGTFSNHPPTDKQVAFLKRLCAERGLEVDPTWVRTKKRCSSEIDRIIKLPVIQAAPGAPLASEKQLGLIRDLMGSRNHNLQPPQLETLTKGQASTLIDQLFAAPKISFAQANLAAPNGYQPVKGDVHFVDGEYYRIHESQGSGRFYAAIFEDGGFRYAKGAITRVSTETLITAEQAAAFGHMHHRCCFCSLKLDTPESTAVGYGPKCAVKHGLPWGVKVA